MGRSPQGERGLKSPRSRLRRPPPGRSPQGERGLKFLLAVGYVRQVIVAPLRGSVG